jgi:hypothetical protein
MIARTRAAATALAALIGVVAALVVVAITASLSSSRPRQEQQDRQQDWRQNYYGASVSIAGSTGTVVRDYVGLWAVVVLPNGKEVRVEWALVVKQVAAACAVHPEAQ